MKRALVLAIPGALGLAAMELVRRSTEPWVRKRAPERTDGAMSDRSMSPFGPRHLPDESAPTAIGRMAYEKLFGRSPSAKMTYALSWGVHIAYGLAVGALFAAVRSHPRPLRDGALYGAGLWLFGDELVVPLLGLSDKPTAYHPTQHAHSLAQHIGYGIALAAATHVLGSRQVAESCSCGCSSAAS